MISKTCEAIISDWVFSECPPCSRQTSKDLHGKPFWLFFGTWHVALVLNPPYGRLKVCLAKHAWLMQVLGQASAHVTPQISLRTSMESPCWASDRLMYGLSWAMFSQYWVRVKPTLLHVKSILWAFMEENVASRMMPVSKLSGGYTQHWGPFTL